VKSVKPVLDAADQDVYAFYRLHGYAANAGFAGCAILIIGRIPERTFDRAHLAVDLRG
jgi:hypothetical protein